MSHQELRRNLPTRLTSFVGREHELTEFSEAADSSVNGAGGDPGLLRLVNGRRAEDHDRADQFIPRA